MNQPYHVRTGIHIYLTQVTKFHTQSLTSPALSLAFSSWGGVWWGLGPRVRFPSREALRSSEFFTDSSCPINIGLKAAPIIHMSLHLAFQSSNWVECTIFLVLHSKNISHWWSQSQRLPWVGWTDYAVAWGLSVRTEQVWRSKTITVVARSDY